MRQVAEVKACTNRKSVSVEVLCGYKKSVTSGQKKSSNKGLQFGCEELTKCPFFYRFNGRETTI